MYQDLDDAVRHLHKHFVIRNDIKPENLIFDEDDRLVLIDFDSARPKGYRLGLKGSTEGFANLNSELAVEENDLFAMKNTLDAIEFVILGVELGDDDVSQEM